MRRIHQPHLWMLFAVIAGALFLSSCSDSSSSPRSASYRVTVTNLTNNQPLSPAGIVLHTAGYTAWEPGASVSQGLEMLAEDGDASDFLDEASLSASVLDVAGGNSAIGPGGSESVDFEISPNADLRISFATMLVNTNDAFSGINDASIAHLSASESATFFARAYDAGTEVNSETPSTIPGPAAGGEGYNPARSDKDFVAVHGGVVTNDDGLISSALNESHRWRNPVVRLMVTRID